MTLLLPTAYLPPISYIAACVGSDEVLIEGCETYPKQTSRNHCEIYGPNGRLRLTIPINKPEGNHTKTKDIRIASDLPWQKIHWRSFETAYNKSPFFLYYQDFFLPFFEMDFIYLLDFNMQLLETLFLAIRLDKCVTVTESFEKDPPGITDLRHLVSDIRHPGSRIPNPEYYQVFADRYGFLPDLSVVDLLFNLGPDTLNYFL